MTGANALPASRTRTTRRPPVIENAAASSRNSDGSEVIASSSSSATRNGSDKSGTTLRAIVLARSRTTPWSGPNTSAATRSAGGFATKRSACCVLTSMGLFRASQMILARSIRLSAQIDRDRDADALGNFVGGAVLGIPLGCHRGVEKRRRGDIVRGQRGDIAAFRDF